MIRIEQRKDGSYDVTITDATKTNVAQGLTMQAVVEALDTRENAHREICDELVALYERKNHDYGDSFHKSFEECGLTMAAIRIGDKYNRFKNLISSDAEVKEESIRDTLLDMANYAIMTIMEVDNGTEGKH